MTTLDQTVAGIAQAQAGTFHLRQLPTGLASRRAVRVRMDSGRWRSPTVGVIVIAGSADTTRQRLWIGHLEAGPDTLVSRRSAATVHHFPGFAEGPIDVLKREVREERTRCCELHISSWIPPHHRTAVEGLPVTTAARTLFDLAGIGSPVRRRRGLPYVHGDRTERAVDDALVRGLTTIDQLAEVLATLGKRGRPGTTLMRAMLETRGDGFVATESALEDLFLSVLTAHGLPHPRRQPRLGGDTPTGRVDFEYPHERVVVECDSRRHHFGRLDAERDRWRDLELASAGWITIRVTWWQLVHEPHRFTSQLTRLLERREAEYAARLL